MPEDTYTVAEILNEYARFYTEDCGVVEDRNVFILWDHIVMKPIAVFANGLYGKYKALAYEMMNGQPSQFTIVPVHTLRLESINPMDGVQLDQCKDLIIGLSGMGYRVDVVRTTKIEDIAEWERITHYHPD